MALRAAAAEQKPLSPCPTRWPRHFPYRWFLLAGVALGAVGWWRLARRDRRLVPIYLMGLPGAFAGAKLAEGGTWRTWPVPWLGLLTGKSVLGALPGGYAGVKFAKARLNYREWTGDRFAALAPAGIALGRVGCLFQGCCPHASFLPAGNGAFGLTGYQLIALAVAGFGLWGYARRARDGNFRAEVSPAGFPIR